MGLIDLVRHGPALIDPVASPSAWRLTDDGRAAVRQLASRMDFNNVSFIASSTERKAIETAEILADKGGVSVRVWPASQELAAEGFNQPDELEQRFANYLQGTADPAFEPWDGAAARVVEAVSAVHHAAHPGRAVVVSHGRILTVYFSTVLGRRLPGKAWNRIQFPDWAAYDPERECIVEGFFSDFAGC